MSFLEKIKSSIYDPGFYKSLLHKPFGEAVQYYMLLTLLITFFRIVFLTFPISTKISTTIHNINTNTISRYPVNLEIKLNNGQLSVNQPQPYRYPYSICLWRNQCGYVVFDTAKPDIKSYLQQKKLLLLFTKDTMYIKIGDQIEIQNLSNINNFTLNYPTVKKWGESLPRLQPFLTSIALIFVGIELYIAALLKLLYFLIVALILWLLAKKFASGMNYLQAYKVTLHLFTLGILVSLLLDVTSWFFHIYSFPLMGTFFALLIFIINFNTAGTKIEKQPVKKAKKK